MQVSSAMENESKFSFFKEIYKRLVLIILVTVLTTLMALAYGMAYVKPVYTVSRSFILSASITNASASNNAALGKIYITQVEDLIMTAEYVASANQKYKDYAGAKTKINASNIGVAYNDNSLIFTLSYKGTDKQEALAKLHAVYITAAEKLPMDMNIGNLDLIDTENVTIDIANGVYEGYMETVDSGLSTCIVVGAVAGLVLSVGIALLLYALDNTVHSKEDLERITGANVLTYIKKFKKKQS